MTLLVSKKLTKKNDWKELFGLMKETSSVTQLTWKRKAQSRSSEKSLIYSNSMQNNCYRLLIMTLTDSFIRMRQNFRIRVKNYGMNGGSASKTWFQKNQIYTKAIKEVPLFVLQ